MDKIFDWDDETLPDFDFVKSKSVVWWNDKQLCIDMDKLIVEQVNGY